MPDKKEIATLSIKISVDSTDLDKLELIRLINFTHNSKGTPEGVPLPRGGVRAENGSFSIFHAVSSR